MMIYSICLNAQDESSKFHFGVFVGLSAPEGDFGSTSSEKAGFADIGFCGMVEGSFEFVPRYYWTTSISLSINSLDVESLQNNLQQILSGINIDAGNYTTTWFMTGLGSKMDLSPTIKLYALLQLGLLVPSYPDITLSYGAESITQTTSSNPAFAYGFGAGLNISQFDIAFRYYLSEPEYEQSASYQGEKTLVTVSMPTRIIEILLGYNF
jgi:hypothetical protein